MNKKPQKAHDKTSQKGLGKNERRSDLTREQERERWKKDAQRRESGDIPGQAPLPGRGQTPDK